MALRSAYSDLDQTGDAGNYARRLDAVAASPFWRDVRQRMAALLDLQPSQRVLDVGCGTGDELRRLAPLLAPGGCAVGVDKSADMIAEASARCSVAVQVDVDFRQGDAQDLRFCDGVFDACRAERILQHVAHPERAVREMLRILRSGGRLALSEPDYATLIVSGGDPRVTARILQVRRDHFLSASAGGCLPGLLKINGAREVTVQLRVLGSTILHDAERSTIEKYASEAVVAGAISRFERGEWLAQLQEAALEARYRHAVLVYIVGGKKA